MAETRARARLDAGSDQAGGFVLRVVDLDPVAAAAAGHDQRRLGGLEQGVGGGLVEQREVGDAERVAEAILAAMRRPVRYIDTDIAVGTSIGIAFNTDPGEEADAWLHRADGALYAAKSAGRGSYRVAA